MNLNKIKLWKTDIPDESTERRRIVGGVCSTGPPGTFGNVNVFARVAGSERIFVRVADPVINNTRTLQYHSHFGTSTAPIDHRNINIIIYKIRAHIKFVHIVMSVKATAAVNSPIVIVIITTTVSDGRAGGGVCEQVFSSHIFTESYFTQIAGRYTEVIKNIMIRVAPKTTNAYLGAEPRTTNCYTVFILEITSAQYSFFAE